MAFQKEMFFDEPGELRCSDVDVPLLTSKSLKAVVMLHLKYITKKKWALLTVGKPDSDTVLLLFDLCHSIVERVYHLVLEVVAPQVHNWAWVQSSEAGISTSVSLNGIESPYQEWNCHSVTEDDVQASLGDSLHRCLGEISVVPLERSDNSEQLLHLVAEEVADKVNRKLVCVTQTTSSRPVEKILGSPHMVMVYHVAKILETCLAQNLTLKFSGPSSSTEDSMDEEHTEVTESSLTQVSPFRGEIFFHVFLIKLLDRLAHSTKTSLLDLDFVRAFKNLEKTFGGTCFPLPQTVGNLHRTVFTKLCREFGSAKLLRAAAVSGDTAFGEAVARELKEQLQKASRKPLSCVGRVRRYFRRRSSKLAPTCEVACLGKGPTPPREQELPAAIGRFSMKTGVLRKLFTCHWGGSQDHKLTSG